MSKRVFAFDLHQVFASAAEKFNVAEARKEIEENGGVPQLECITPLRLLLASEKDAERWKSQVKDMEAHNKKRCTQAQWSKDQVNIVDYMRNRLKLQRYSSSISFNGSFEELFLNQ